MAKDSIQHTLIITVGLCLACSLLVATAAVKLGPRQTENARLDKVKNILIAGNLYDEGTDIAATYEKMIEAILIDMKTGEVIPAEAYTDELDIDNFDQVAMSAHPEYGMDVPADVDVAMGKRMPKKMVVYFEKEGDMRSKVIVPIWGRGLWSTLYGFLALRNDWKTVEGITYYQHGETPGLGGEVDNPSWKKIWNGKQAFDENWNVTLRVLKGSVNPASPDADSQIDGLSGATITTRGVNAMVRFWLGEDGYGPFLAKLRGSVNE